MPVRVEVLIRQRQDEGTGSSGMPRSERRERILHPCRPEGIRQIYAGQRYRWTERSILYKVVVEPREGLDVEPAPPAANSGRVIAREGRPREAQPRRQVAEIRIEAAGRKIRIARKQQAFGSQRKALRLRAGNVSADLFGNRIGIGNQRVPAQSQIQGQPAGDPPLILIKRVELEAARERRLI